MDITLHPVERLESGERLYAATITYPNGQRLQLQSTISEELHASVSAWIAAARGWFTEHVHTSGPITGCSKTPGLCPHDIAGALFVGISEALAELPESAIESPEQLVTWSWDDYGVDYDRLVDDLTAHWNTVFPGVPMIDYAGNGIAAPQRKTIVRAPSGAKKLQAPKELYYAYALAAT